MPKGYHFYQAGNSREVLNKLKDISKQDRLVFDAVLLGIQIGDISFTTPKEVSNLLGLKLQNVYRSLAVLIKHGFLYRAKTESGKKIFKINHRFAHIGKLRNNYDIDPETGEILSHPYLIPTQSPDNP